MSTTLTPSNLKQIDDTDTTTWQTRIGENITLLNNTLLKVSGMGDVNLAGLEDRDALVWSSSGSEYIAHKYTTTTTTTTTTTSSTTTTTTA